MFLLAVMIGLSTAAHAQHTRFTDGLALGDLAGEGLKSEAFCDRAGDLTPLPGMEPPRIKPSFAGEVSGSHFRGTEGERNAGVVGGVRAHLAPPGPCSWDLRGFLLASTRGGRGAQIEAKIHFPRGDAGAVALFATGRYAHDSLAARELHLDRELAAGASYTTFNLYRVTLGAIARLFGDTETRLDFRARVSGSAVAAGGSVIRPATESGDMLRRVGFLTMLHVLHSPVSVVYEAEETDRLVAGRDWRRYNIAGVYRLSEENATSIILRRTVQGLSRDRRDREWAVHLSKLVF